MNALSLCEWITQLGRLHEAMLREGILKDEKLKTLFDGHDVEYLTVTPGVELQFSLNPATLKGIHITLKSTLPHEIVYEGELPERLQGITNLHIARKNLGTPYRAHPPVQMPTPMGHVGGWDAFIYDSACQPVMTLMIQYNDSLEVCDVVFLQGRFNLRVEE